jgi:peptide/nickel transport system ATP-binding protein
LSKPLLSIQNLTVSFTDGDRLRPAVQNISFTMGHGEVVAVVGESGSGKSVSALSILQLLDRKNTRFTNGEIIFSKDGLQSVNLLELEEKAMRRIRGSDIGMVFQEPMTALNPVFTCGQQVTEAIRAHHHLSAARARQKCLELFRQVQLPEPERIFKSYPHEISGGQKQRVMIAMAISCQPALLIADEPTTALDVTVQKSILGLLAELRAQTNMGMLFITHDLGVVKDIADRVIVLYRGSIVEQNTKEAIFTAPAHPYTKALLNCRPILYPKGKRLPVVADFLQNEQPPPATPPMAEAFPTKDKMITSQAPIPLLTVEDLSVQYPVKRNFWGRDIAFKKAVDRVSFEVYQGETLGLVGESGCGKTSLGRALLRLIPSCSGRILYQGKDLNRMEGRDLRNLRKELQIVFQDPYSSLNPRITIGDAILEAMTVQGLGAGPRDRKDRVMALLEKVQLQSDHFSRYPHAFSGGQRQRIGIARALALEPRFIVFDESVSALDVSVQAQVLNLINDLKASFNFTALFISHDLGVVRYISDRIIVMQAGKIEEMGNAETVFNHPRAAYTRKLLNAIPGNEYPAN